MASIALDTSRQPATYWVTDVPDQTVGRNGDTAINETTGVRYTKDSGLWTVAGSLTAASATVAGGSTSSSEDLDAINTQITVILAALAAQDVRLDTLEGSTAAQVYETTIGDGSSTTFTVTHGLNRLFPASARLWDIGTNVNVRGFDLEPVDVNSCDIVFDGYTPTSGQFRLELTG